MPVDTPWLEVPEAAEYARRHTQTIKNALRDGSLRGSQTKRNGKWLVHRDDLDAWLRGEIADVQPPAVTRRSRRSVAC